MYLVHGLCFSMYDATLSSYEFVFITNYVCGCHLSGWRHYVKGDRKWPCILIDHIFFWQENHCKTAYESELLQKQLPPACRQDND